MNRKIAQSVFVTAVLFLCLTVQANPQADFVLDGGGFQILDGGIPSGCWTPRSFIMDYAQGNNPGFEYMQTRLWSIGEGDVTKTGYRGRFNFYIMDGTNNPVPPYEIPVFTIDNWGRVACGDMGSWTPDPPSDFTIFQGENNFDNGLWIIKSEYNNQGRSTAYLKNYARQFCIDDSNTLHIRWAASGSDVTIDENSNITVGGSSLTIKNSKTPKTSRAAGVKGQIQYDTNYMYICVNANTWKRIPLLRF